MRETRHLWVGNLPKDVREDKITEHFERSVSLTAEHMVARSRPRPCQRAGAGVRSAAERDLVSICYADCRPHIRVSGDHGEQARGLSELDKEREKERAFSHLDCAAKINRRGEEGGRHAHDDARSPPLFHSFQLEEAPPIPF